MNLTFLAVSKLSSLWELLNSGESCSWGETTHGRHFTLGAALCIAVMNKSSTRPATFAGLIFS